MCTSRQLSSELFGACGSVKSDVSLLTEPGLPVTVEFVSVFLSVVMVDFKRIFDPNNAVCREDKRGPKVKRKIGILLFAVDWLIATQM